ncbi:MAG: tyrosine transporter [Gammaproteobacteria bacterium]|nr:tyrosine transporter [Gammaproteobacteria bacterium]
MINKTTGGTLIIAGTCIGAGMLALPVAMASGGFIGSCGALIIFWLAMALTGLYVLEVNLYLPSESNFISMAKLTLGKPGEIVAWSTYLLLLYSLMAAYLSGGGDLVESAYSSVVHSDLQSWIKPLPWMAVASVAIYFGTRAVDRLNRLLFAGLIATYFLMVFFTIPHINMSYLLPGKPLSLLYAFPILSTAFGYHVVIPSMRLYLSGAVNNLVKIILLGSFITLVVYIFWDLVVFGTIPTNGPMSLEVIQHSGQPATKIASTLAALSHNTSLVMIIEFFIFFAISTSFIGISLALFDFLTDGLKIPRTALGKFLSTILTFVPPLTYALFFTKGFILALSYAGVFVAILHGLLPAAMAWSGRNKRLPELYLAPGGKLGMAIIMLFSLLIIVMQMIVNI